MAGIDYGQFTSTAGLRSLEFGFCPPAARRPGHRVNRPNLLAGDNNFFEHSYHRFSISLATTYMMTTIAQLILQATFFEGLW